MKNANSRDAIFSPSLMRPALAFALVLGLAIIVSFQNCARFEVASNLNSGDQASISATIGLTTGGTTLQPATDRIDPTCMTNTAFDACLFRKNPVAHKGTSFSGTPGVNESLEKYQTYGVRLTGLDSSGKLQNSTIRVRTAYGTPVSTNVTALRVSAMDDGTEAFTQVATYYWMNRAVEYIEPRTGVFPAKGKGVYVIVDDTLAGWSPVTNSIHLRIAASSNKMAWNSDLAIYFLGLANLHYATNGAIRSLDASKHRTCGAAVSGCCVSKTGCARAVASGVGDYFVGMMFPDQPTVGETWVNGTSGLTMCTKSRHLEANAALTAQDAFDSCAASGGTGEATTMGTIYASIWWSVRKSALNAKGDSGAAEVDTLFMQHLALLAGSDDFSTALSKIKSLDQRLFNGSYSARFDSEYNARGL